MATNGNINHDQYAAASGEAPKAHTKDEVGWYFVEQYYNTLSKHPHRLHVSSAHLPNISQYLSANIRAAVLQQALPVRPRSRGPAV